VSVPGAVLRLYDPGLEGLQLRRVLHADPRYLVRVVGSLPTDLLQEQIVLLVPVAGRGLLGRGGGVGCHASILPSSAATRAARWRSATCWAMGHRSYANESTFPSS